MTPLIRIPSRRRVTLRLALAVALSLLAPGWAHAGLNRWTSNGPPGGACTRSVVVGLGAPAAVYATTCNGIFASLTGGATWTLTNGGLGYTSVNSVSVDPKTPTTLYALTQSGLFKTLDAGEHWTPTTVTANVMALAIDPTDSNILYAGTSGVFKSTDGGASWNPANTSLPQGTIYALAVDPQNPSHVYVANSVGVFKSTDAGNSWNPLLSGSAVCVVIDPHTSTTLYACTNPLSKSVDGGQHWVSTGFPSPFLQSKALTIDPQTPSTLYATAGSGCCSGLFKSTDAGATWASIAGLLTEARVLGIAIDPQTPTTLYAAVSTGVAKSTDAGNTWTIAQHGLPSGQLALAIDPHDSTTLVAATCGSFDASPFDGSPFRIYRSSSGGGTWAHLTSPSDCVQALAIAPQAPTTIYAGGRTSAGCAGDVLKSIDGGTTWTPGGVGSPRCARMIVVDPANSTIVYATAALVNGGDQWYPLYKTANSGASWGTVGPSSVSTLALDPQHPSTLYVATSPLAGPGAMYKSTDAGLTWTKVLDASVAAIVVDSATSTTIYAAVSTGILKSMDAGLHWTAMNTGLDGSTILALTLDPQAPDVLYAATLQGGVFRSSDSANTWSPMNAGLPSGTVVTSLAVAASGSCVYLAGSGLIYAFAVRPDPCNRPLVAAVLPTSRSVQVGGAATAFVTVINAGSTLASQVALSLATPLAATFTYQTTNPTTNQVTGTPNTAVDIPAGQSQTYVIAVTPTAPFAPTNVALTFSGANTEPPGTLVGINTLLLSAAANSVPDIVALAASGDPGIVDIPGATGTGVFAVATVNLGAGASITASADTGGVALPLTISLCQTNPATGVCLAAPASSVTTQINAGTTPTFGIFVTGTTTVPFDPANNRIFVRFTDAGAVIRGATSVAVRTQ